MNLKINIKFNDNSAKELLIPISNIKEITIKTVSVDKETTAEGQIEVFPGPVWDDICCHGREFYVGTIDYCLKPHDVYHYRNTADDGKMHTCVRHGPQPEDYVGFGRDIELMPGALSSKIKLLFKQKNITL